MNSTSPWIVSISLVFVLGLAGVPNAVHGARTTTPLSVPQSPSTASPALPAPVIAEEPPAVTSTTFAGRWRTTFGAMDLSIDGDRVRGTYAYGGGSTIDGRLTEGGTRLELTYVEPNMTGEAWFVLDDTRQRFMGKWRDARGGPWRDWAGMREGAVVPGSGRRSIAGGDPWLIILEANWESDLAEPPYDFGSMLRQYFTMATARHVRVRHRFFHDEADFRRLAGEAAAMNEPVVLLISSHGTEAGIVSPGGIIGPDVIADALREGQNLALLHLSGCMMMSGDVPAAIHAKLPEGTSFPISGYSAVVPWDASAISDFIYLSFLLIHRMPPIDAARQAILTAPYLGDSAPEGSLFPPLGLRVMERAVRPGPAPAKEPIEPALQGAVR